MHTEHIEYLLPDYLSGMLEPSLLQMVESHLAECPACRAEMESLHGSMQILGSYEARPPHEGYFQTVLPRVRERLQRRESLSFFAHPVVTRFAAPLVVGALLLVILFRASVSMREAEPEPNPLKPFVHGLDSGELVDVILDQAGRETISGNGVNETSSLLAVPLLKGEHLLAGTEQVPLPIESILDAGMHENLDQLSPAELEALVAGLGERTIL